MSSCSSQPPCTPASCPMLSPCNTIQGMIQFICQMSMKVKLIEWSLMAIMTIDRSSPSPPCLLQPLLSLEGHLTSWLYCSSVYAILGVRPGIQSAGTALGRDAGRDDTCMYVRTSCCFPAPGWEFKELRGTSRSPRPFGSVLPSVGRTPDAPPKGI